jgi:predicted acyl esterase
MKQRLAILCGLVLAVFAQSPTAAPQDRPPAQEFDVRAHYTKYEVRVPMRDGVRLFTSIYVPKDTSHSYPFLMTRTPYSVAPYGADHYRPTLGPTPAFDRAG